jgi:spore coat polysaccharide biosynthesis predicted glycosyltransferase SpsG
MRILIRADAGLLPEIGTGHVLRSIKLADALKSTPDFQDAEILFATREQTPYELGGKFLRQASYDLIEHSGLEPNSECELRSVIQAQPDIVIFDRLETTADLVVNLKDAGIFVVSLDDLGQGRFHADLAIHSLFQNVEPKPNIFVGYEYLFLVSDEIVRTELRRIASKVFVSFGGYDKRQLSTYFLNLIPKINGPNRYEIVVSGLSSRDLDTFKGFSSDIATISNVEIIVYQRPNNFYQLLCSSDLAIVSGGLTAFDCAQAGVPAIVIPQHDHQLENIKRLENFGCLKIGARNMELDPQLVCNLVTDLSMDYQQRLAMNKAGRKVIDGQGLQRTIRLITQTYYRE